MIRHIENVLKEDMDTKASINYLVEKLATISESNHNLNQKKILKNNEKRS